MSDFGVFLLLFATLAVCLGLIRFFAWLTDVREAGGPVAYWRAASGRYVVNTNAQPAPNVMSRAEDTTAVRNQFDRPEPAAVLTGTHQVEPSEPSNNEPVREPSKLYRLSRRDEIVMLAIQRNDDGSYRHSANQITAFVGGTAADVKDIIREVREGAVAAKSPPPSHNIQRPVNGWN